jgi:hypothetical protein
MFASIITASLAIFAMTYVPFPPYECDKINSELIILADNNSLSEHQKGIIKLQDNPLFYFGCATLFWVFFLSFLLLVLII